jgi:hypothetical protein
VQDVTGTVEVEISVPLAESGLRHRKHADCGCGGRHPVTAQVDLNANYLHCDDDCPATPEPPAFREDLQRLHELAHPHGALFAEYCLERECISMVAFLQEKL